MQTSRANKVKRIKKDNDSDIALRSASRGKGTILMEEKASATPSVKRLCKCGNPRRPNQRNCRQCHAVAQKKYREIARLRTSIMKSLLDTPESSLAFQVAFDRSIMKSYGYYRLKPSLQSPE